jgi:hypothetical protein
MLQPKQSPKEKKNTKDATQMKNMKPVFKGPNSKLPMPKNLTGKARNGKPVKKAFLGSLLGGAGGGAGGSMLGGMGKQMLGGMASQALGGLMGGGNKGGGQAAAQGGQGSEAQAPMQKRKSTDMTPVKTKSMMKKGGKVSKAKNGKSFPDLNKDGKITKADILKGRGVIAKKGMSVKKAQNGAKTKDSTDYFKGRSAHFFAKSYKPGYTGAEARILREVSDDFDKDATRQAKKGKSGYDKNGYPLKKKAKTGTSVKKCRGGCK